MVFCYAYCCVPQLYALVNGRADGEDNGNDDAEDDNAEIPVDQNSEHWILGDSLSIST